MIYTLATRARRNGIYFERHELAPLGITEESMSWGLWVEGRGFEDASRLDGEERWHENETPHLVVSPIQPHLWPTAFSLQAMLQRRRRERGVGIEHCDSFYGFADALARCGVNILFTQTAQVGYDLIVVNMICDLPRLREPAAALLAMSDDAGRDMEKARQRYPDLDSNEHRFKRKKVSQDVFVRRVAAFQCLGRLLLPRLAELEARLTSIDRSRFTYWQTIPEKDTPEERLRLIENERRAVIETHARGHLHSILLGRQPPPSTQPDSRDTTERALATPWYLNKKVVSAGENSYFLAYESIRNRELINSELYKPADNPDLDDNQRKLYQSRLDALRLSVKGNDNRPGLSKKNGELDAGEIRALYSHVLSALKGRDIDGSMRSMIPESKGRGHEEGTRDRRSGTAERLMGIDDAQLFEQLSNLDFFRQQALVPVRISAMPSLAYARFWAFGGGIALGTTEQHVEGQRRGAPIQFRYADRLLQPEGPRANPPCRLTPILEFLNNVSFPKGPDERGEFAPQMAVLANMNLPDRFMRLRFSRQDVEPQSYLTVRVQLGVLSDKDLEASSSGFLCHVSALLLKHHFRIERLSNTLLDGDSGTEGGRLEVVARAADASAVVFCNKIANMSKAEWAKLCEEWQQDLMELARNPTHLTKPVVRIAVGFVPEDR